MGYTTGVVAKKFSLSKDSLRYYEKEGLLSPIERDSSAEWERFRTIPGGIKHD